MTQVSGVYSVTYAHGAETLSLREDGTYTQTYVSSPDRQTITNEGKWKMGNQGDEVYLVNALLFDTGTDKPNRPPVKSDWGLNIVGESPVTLSMNPDRTLLFVKAP